MSEEAETLTEDEIEPYGSNGDLSDEEVHTTISINHPDNDFLYARDKAAYEQAQFLEWRATIPRTEDGINSQRLVDINDSGLLWLINKTVFHPRGYSLGLSPTGHTILSGDGSTPFGFGEDTDERLMMNRAKAWMPN